MTSPDLNKRFNEFAKILDNYEPFDWQDIVSFLKDIKKEKNNCITAPGQISLKSFAEGAAFITFSYGIDGVSMETAKYAQTLTDLLAPFGKPAIHFIGGRFQPQVSTILKDDWHRFEIEGINGWNKWDGGKWFKALFRRKMSSSSEESDLLVTEIYRQAVSIAKRLGKYFIDNQISLVVPVNIASNPGNIALTLGLVLITEGLGLFVLNSNHDFYWEAGKPLAEREPGEEPGVRDHFFRNIKNETFFSLFELLYPWNGDKWLQVNINARQSRKLIHQFGIPEGKVHEISTYISDAFFEPFSQQDVMDNRLRMAHILSDGEPIMRPDSIADFLSAVNEWMKNQQPRMIGARPGLSVDPISKDLLIMLQPTRIVSRKRIEKNLKLIGALLKRPMFRGEFETNLNLQLVLLITGPAPKEHQEDLEKVLFAYEKLIQELPDLLADRIFLAFSVGRENHASFSTNALTPLTIEALYEMANVVVFPSKTEGRGLPIIEASASGIPIICCHYRPKEVFSDVIGENSNR